MQAWKNSITKNPIVTIHRWAFQTWSTPVLNIIIMGQTLLGGQFALRLLSTFRGHKKSIFFYLTKLNIKISPDVSIQNFLKSSKVPELSRKTYFEIKMNKSERCPLRPERIPWGIFAATAHFFMLFPYFVSIVHLTKFTQGSSLLMEKSLAIKKSKAEESPC